MWQQVETYSCWLIFLLQLGTTTVGGKQTIVITKPGGGGPSGVRPQTSQIIVVTTASAMRGLQPAATTPITTPAGAQAAQVRGAFVVVILNI